MQVTIDRDVLVAMRDGTGLRADVIRNAAAGPTPVLLLRTPYGKQQLHFSTLPPLMSVERGYTVVLQDCRGTGASDGVFEPFASDIEDGYDTVEWCAAQEWSSGEVGMYGTSYMGATPWLAAISSPPSLRTVATSMTASDYSDGWIFQGGAFNLAFTLGWTAEHVALPALARSGISADELAERERQIRTALRRLREQCLVTPLNAHPLFTEAAPAPAFFDWLERGPDDPFWQRVSIAANADKVQIPALSIGGWYDLFAGGPPQTFRAVRTHGATEDARRQQRLLMGPWNHGAPGAPRGMNTAAGAVDFTLEAAVDFQELLLSWFDWQLLGRAPDEAFRAPVRYFMMGANEWREAQDWPPENAQIESLYLSSDGDANGSRGGGTLSREPAGDEPADHFLSHPLRPVPTVGGGGRFDGSFDQARVEAREDVLVYTTPPLKEALEVAGPVSVELYVSSSAVETDFTAKLVEVSPSGFARNLCDGIARTRYRLPAGTGPAMEPGSVYQIRIDLLNTANRFVAGSAIRLEVASANFPRFDRNPNTGELAAGATQLLPAHQRVHHSAQYPSRLELATLRE